MRWLILAFTFATFAGCSLADSLENAPCDGDDDCLGSYTCVKTVHQTASALPGLCRDDGKCAAGQQEGCVTAAGSCTDFQLTVVTDESTGASYCCATGGAANPSVTMADGASARCVACPSDLCTGDADEPCSEGDARCVVTSGGCGCRVPANEIENSDCVDAATCGEGFVCTRTLEQEAEPDEPLPEEQEQEPGWCRPDDMPECVGGSQVGCRTDGTMGCLSSQNYSCTATGRCYCCDDPADSSNFTVHVYTETGSGESAACIECRRSDCATQTCTLLEDASCVVSSGVCGCTPA